MSGAAGFQPDVTIDEQVPMPEGYDAARIRRVVAGTLRQEEAAGLWEIAIAFVSDAAMQVLHRDFLNDDSPTDIMTFPREEAWPGQPDSAAGGDIAISVDRAAAQAGDEGWDTAHELEFLVVHGMLHLLGWDDFDPEDRAAMLERQRDILRVVT
jgi:probable rRNA maturation factor